MEDYAVTPRAYLGRCRDQIRLNTKASMFYAAFELKCAVEAQIAEHLEHLDSQAGKRIKPYKIGQNARIIQKLKIGEVIIKMIWSSQDGSLLKTCYHTPVPDALKRYAECVLDELRHAQHVYRKPNDDWWNEKRQGLIENYRLAWLSSRGTVPIPPLFDLSKPLNGGMPLANSVVFLYPDDEEVDTWMEKDTQVNLEIDYLEEPPAEWVCDL